MRFSATAPDVIVLVLDFPASTGTALSHPNLRMIADLDKSLWEMAGLRGYSSLLNAPVVKAERDEILVVPYITKGLLEHYQADAAGELMAQYMSFPEVHPYLSADFQTVSFYLEPGLTYPSHRLMSQIEMLRSHIWEKYGFSFEFTGLRAIQVATERYITQDILKMLPFLFLLVSMLYFFIFRSIRVLLISWLIKILAAGSIFAS